MICSPNNVFQMVPFSNTKELPRAVCRFLCQEIAKKFFANFQIICPKINLNTKTITKIGSDVVYQIYFRQNPPGKRKFTTIVQKEYPAIPSLAESFLEMGRTYFRKPTLLTFEEGKVRLEKMLSTEKLNGNDMINFAYRHYQENRENYEKPEFRREMARWYHEYKLDLSLTKPLQQRGKERVAHWLCQKEINDLYWEEYEVKQKIQDAKIMATFNIYSGLASSNRVVSTQNLEQIERDCAAEAEQRFSSPGWSPEWERTYRYGRPALIKEMEESIIRLQTPEEHRLEWDQKSALAKLGHLILCSVPSKRGTCSIVSWIFSCLILYKLTRINYK